MDEITWFTADLHLGHANIIGYCNRPYYSVSEMDRGLIDNINMHVSPEDTLYIIGDICLGKIDESLEMISQLNGHLILVPGNHDRCWPGHGAKHAKWIDRYLEAGIDEITEPEFDLTLGGTTQVRVCHFPYYFEHHTDVRYLDWRPKHDPDQWLLHGHVHDTWKIQGNMINCGVDVWGYAPVSEQQLITTITASKYVYNMAF